MHFCGNICVTHLCFLMFLLPRTAGRYSPYTTFCHSATRIRLAFWNRVSSSKEELELERRERWRARRLCSLKYDHKNYLKKIILP